ncbi:MAG: hypothetical protein KKE30_04850 [Gammaproteobacteria bacterium]|nr:hypothetical protein [Gammaproteobacteria bacterium]MBU1555383.1 hypothetical protein [Gammaproteobacteria bacterium]MBU2070547.1 hypothetical protein [Gammaproteobacteria bacterium]MBU2185359.1 hypothetical protein [Gammaproteobacteria bacterium]MBU2207053.1 hypothetical protein [Gammaproteobacteria bacterium]
MTKFNTTVNTVIILAGLLGSSAALAQQPEPTDSRQPIQTEVQQNVSDVTEHMLNEFQQQLSSNIKQQVGQTLQSLAESIKQLL